jgi:hypothetical protein
MHIVRPRPFAIQFCEHPRRRRGEKEIWSSPPLLLLRNDQTRTTTACTPFPTSALPTTPNQGRTTARAPTESANPTPSTSAPSSATTTGTNTGPPTTSSSPSTPSRPERPPPTPASKPNPTNSAQAQRRPRLETKMPLPKFFPNKIPYRAYNPPGGRAAVACICAPSTRNRGPALTRQPHQLGGSKCPPSLVRSQRAQAPLMPRPA